MRRAWRVHSLSQHPNRHHRGFRRLLLKCLNLSSQCIALGGLIYEPVEQLFVLLTIPLRRWNVENRQHLVGNAVSRVAAGAK